MSNHYHLLISTPDSNIGDAMKYLHREVARRANKNSKRINHFFGGRYKWSIVNSENYYWNAVKYIFRNPVRAGICNSVKDYKYSSLNSSSKEFLWKMTDYFYDQQKQIELDISWLEESYTTEVEESIRFALRRREFKLPRNKQGHENILNSPDFINSRQNYVSNSKPNLVHLQGDMAHAKKGTVTLPNFCGQ